MNLKQVAGEKAVEFIEEGMVVGLGSGTTADFATRKIGQLIQQGLKITAVCTSVKTRKLADKLRIPYVDMNEVSHIDVTIDGADEVDPQGHGIKGGGGALLFEKIVASCSKQIIWVVEERKLVQQLGAFPLPVEIMTFGHECIVHKIANMGFKPELRKTGEEIFTTDGGHYIVDLHQGFISDPYQLNIELSKIPGVLEHGLFLNMVNKVVSASDKKVEIITYR